MVNAGHRQTEIRTGSCALTAWKPPGGTGIGEAALCRKLSIKYPKAHAAGIDCACICNPSSSGQNKIDSGSKDGVPSCIWRL